MKLLKGFPAVLLAIALCQAPAQGITISYLDSDASFLAEAAGNGWIKEFGQNVRWGNNAANGDWEFSVVNGSDIPQDQVNTPISGAYDFEFDYVSGTAGLTVGTLGTSQWAPSPGSSINTMYIRARAGDNNTASMTGLTLTIGSDVFNLGTLLGDSNAQYIRIVDSGLSGDWSLTGTGTLLGGGTTRGSDPMYQIKVGHIAVPGLVSTGLLLALGCIPLGIAHRKLG